MMKTGFFDRVTLCSSCGAPLEVPREARAVRCQRCGAESQLALRIDDAVSGGWSEDELARLSHLRSQDRGYAPDAAIAPLVAGMRLGRAHVEAAFTLWQRMRAALRPGDVAEERPFTELSLLLAWRAAEDGDPHRERGLLETALGLVRAPRHCQMLRASLAVLARRMGDAQGAEAWLALCDARAADLRSDSYYRYARALLDTASGELSRVLGVLGGNDVEVPIVDELSGPCALVRANAWERLGRPGTAVDLLSHLKHEGDPFAQQLARAFLSIHPALALCETSEPRAEAERQRSLGRRQIGWTKGMVIVLILVLHFLLSALAMFAFGVASLFASGVESGALSILFAFISLVPSGLLIVPFFRALRRTQRERALLSRGEIAPARVLSVSVTAETPARTDFAATVWVVPDFAPPVEVQTTIGASPERFAELAAGRPFTVRHRDGGILIEPVLR